MSHGLPFTCEYAKSGRAGCKGCKMNIDKDDLRLGIMVQSPHFDGKIPMWHHEKCFFRKARIENIGDLHGFDNLRWEDQEKLKKIIEGWLVRLSTTIQIKNPNVHISCIIIETKKKFPSGNF